MSELRYAEIVEQSISDGLDWDDFRVFLEVVRMVASTGRR